MCVSLFYPQGMNFIAGYLLIITKDEEKSFWLMDALLGRILPGVCVCVCIRVCIHTKLAPSCQLYCASVLCSGCSFCSRLRIISSEVTWSLSVCGLRPTLCFHLELTLTQIYGMSISILKKVGSSLKGVTISCFVWDKKHSIRFYYSRCKSIFFFFFQKCSLLINWDVLQKVKLTIVCVSVCVCVYRLLQSSHAGAKDGPGGVRGATENKSPQRVADHGGSERHVDPGGLPVVHLPLHRRLASGGECQHVTAIYHNFFILKGQEVISNPKHFLWSSVCALERNPVYRHNPLCKLKTTLCEIGKHHSPTP